MTFFIVLGAIGGSYVKERGEGVEKRSIHVFLSKQNVPYQNDPRIFKLFCWIWSE